MTRRRGKQLLPNKEQQREWFRNLRYKAQLGDTDSQGWLLWLSMNKQQLKELEDD